MWDGILACNTDKVCSEFQLSWASTSPHFTIKEWHSFYRQSYQLFRGGALGGQAGRALKRLLLELAGE